MTICASVKVRDGLVLATDSMTQITGQRAPGSPQEILKSYVNARKLFQVKNYPVGVMSYGIGNVGNRSIQRLVGDFNDSVKVDKNVEEVARELFSFFSSAYTAEYSHLPADQQQQLGFYVAGYSEGKAFPEEWEFVLPSYAAPQMVRPEQSFGSAWRGVDIAFSRLFTGYDPRIPQLLANAGLDNDTVQAVMAVLQGLKASVVYDGMPVQDAINFAAYIVRTTVGMSTYEIGPPSCGGPLQLAIILPETGFEWVEKPTYYVEAG